jgi:uncharacterized protein
MPPYFSPGVYVEEIKPKAQAIAGVGTSTAGFVGVVPATVKLPDQPGKFGADGKPLPYSLSVPEKAILLTSWEEFKRNFGDFQAMPAGGGDGGGAVTSWVADDATAYQYLQHAVYGFFNNGGTRCWVIRVLGIADLEGADAVKKQLNRFATIDEIALVLVPGATTKVQQDTILAHCFALQDRFAILDGVRLDEEAAVTADAIALSGRSDEPGSYGAIYYPWIKVSSPTAPSTLVAIPPSGHMAGIYARSDGARGVFKAPANEVVIGAADLDRPISRALQDGLNPKGINVIRAFNGTIKVWGARTLSETAPFGYVSTRRFFNFLRESIDEGTQFAVFEPNSPSLWQGITQTLNGFLLNQWRDGALFGATPEQAFFVKCDKDTNPKEVRELGQVITEIGVAIVKPAEFVIFRIQQTTGN